MLSTKGRRSADVPCVSFNQTREFKAGANTPVRVGMGGMGGVFGGANDYDSLVQPQGDPLVNISAESGLRLCK